MITNMKTDVLVVGGGCAGLRAAIAAKMEGADVCLVSKGRIGKGSSTAFLDHLVEFTALGVSLNEQDKIDYEMDLLDYGHEVNDRRLVRYFVDHTKEQLDFLQQLGMDFSEETIMLPSHRKPRILRAMDDFGTNVLLKLKEKASNLGIRILEQTALYYIDKEHFPSTCRLLSRNAEQGGYEDISVDFKSLVFATGGGGQIYSLSTNPIGTTADGTGFAIQLGAEVTNLEFIHYLPLLVKPIHGFYIVSSIITKGRFLNTKGEEFIAEIPKEKHSLTETEKQGYLLLEVCQWIEKQILEGNVTEDSGVFWDGRHLIDLIRQKIPHSYQKLLQQGLDLGKDVAEISIGCHQMMGGIKIDLNGASSIPGLFAAGETAGGFQGAERLMGTGVMDGLVFGTTAGRNAAIFAKGFSRKEQPSATIFPGSAKPKKNSITRETITLYKKQLKRTMDRLLITKDQQRIDEALESVNALFAKIEGYHVLEIPIEARIAFAELNNMLHTAKAILVFSQWRKESRGSFKRTDYPDKDPQFARSFTYSSQIKFKS